jgi:hypothetical protein
MLMGSLQPIDGFPSDRHASSFYQIRVAASSNICKNNSVAWVFNPACPAGMGKYRAPAMNATIFLGKNPK